MARGAEKIVGLLLAGGSSTRLGRDKATLVLPGSRQTLAENARRILEAAGLPVVVAARDRERAQMLLPGCTAVEDGPGRGPAAALLGAHAAYPDRAFVALACDMPLVPPELLRLLPEITGDWVAPAWSPGTLTPLPPSPADGRGGRTIDSWRGFAPPTPHSGEEGEPEGAIPSQMGSPPWFEGAPEWDQVRPGTGAQPSSRRRPGSSPHTDPDWGLGPGLRRGDERGASALSGASEIGNTPPGEPEGRSPSLQIGSPPSPSAERGAGGRGPYLRLEPLCALYRPKALEALARRVAAGRFDLRGLAGEEGVVVTHLGQDRIAEIGDPAAIFRNINEPRDLDDIAALPPRGSADTIRG